MATTQSQLDALLKARATGVLEVEVEGRRTRFRNLDEMNTIIAALERDLGAPQPPLNIVVRSSKGW
jgi:hypothetical protein